MGEVSVAGFQDHHIIPRNSVAHQLIIDAFSRFPGYSWNVNSRPVARVLLPSTRNAVTALGNVSRHAGGHGTYTSAVNQAVLDIIRMYGHDPVALSNALDQFAINIRAKILTGQLSLSGNDPRTAALILAHDQIDPNLAPHVAQQELDARTRASAALLSTAANANGGRTLTTLLAGYNDAQLGQIAVLDPSVLNRAPRSFANISQAAKDAIEAASPGTISRWQGLLSAIAAIPGLAHALDLAEKLGFAGDVIGIGLTFAEAERLYQQGQLSESNRVYALFAAELAGGLAGAVLGAAAGPLSSLASSTLGSVGVRAAAEKLWVVSPDFRNFVSGIINEVRQSVASALSDGDAATAQAIQEQLPTALNDMLVDGDYTYTFTDANGQPLIDTATGDAALVLRFDPVANTLTADRPGAANDTTVSGIDEESIGRELGEIILHLNAPLISSNQPVDQVQFASNVILPDGSTFTLVNCNINGNQATLRVFRAAGSRIQGNGDVVVTPYRYSIDGRNWIDKFGRDVDAPPSTWEISVLEAHHPDGTVTRELAARVQQEDVGDTAAGESAADAFSYSLIPFAQIGSIFGSNLAQLIPTDELWQSTLLGTALGTLGLNIGQAIERAQLLKQLPAELHDRIPGAFDNFPSEFAANLANAGAGVVSSILVADLIDTLGLDGTLYGDWLQTKFSTQLTTVITNLPQILNGDFSSLGQINGANLLGGFLGTQLAAKLVHFDTIGGQVGASIGSALGTLYGTKILGKIGFSVAGPVGAFIGAFVGYILGGLIGSLFGGKPKSGAELGWDDHEQRYAVSHVWSKGGGAKDTARSFATNVAELLNGVISAAGSKVVDPMGVRVGAYGQLGKDFVYWATSGLGAGSVTFRTRDPNQLIAHGQFVALADLSTRLMGGDVYVKRAIGATITQAGGNSSGQGFAAGAFEANVLLGNIAVAQSYGQYLQNAAVINALIGAEPQSPFAASWVVTFARVFELGLDKRASSDWIGGWNAFLDEVPDGLIDGFSLQASNIFHERDLDTNERLFVFVDEQGSLLGVLGDTIDTASKDVIAGTAGADALTVNGDVINLTTSLTLNGAIATAGDFTIRVAALIDGGAGDDVIRGGDLGNDLLGGDGNDTLVGGKLDDWLLGGAGNDRLFAGDANVNFTTGDAAAENAALAVDGGNGDYLEGGDGDDALYGSTGSDWLSGGAGVDRILGGAGGDILVGGAGDEKGVNGDARLLGGAGSDQYVFGFGDGKDVIFDESDPAGALGASDGMAQRISRLNAGTEAKNWAGGGQYLENGDVRGGEDAIVFGAGVTMQNIVLQRVGEDLVIALQAPVNSVMTLTGDEITIKDWFNVTRRVEWFRFADGEEIRIGDVTSFVAGSTGPDVIIGSFGADFIVGGSGDDQIRGLAGDDYGFGGAGKDFVAGDSDNDMVSGGSDDDEVIGGAGNDTVFGDDGADDLYGGTGADILAGGRGDDFVVTGAGNDIVRFQRGDGRDVLMDEFVNNWDVVWTNGVYQAGYALQADGTVTNAGQVVFDGSKWVGRYDWDDATQTLRRHKGAVSGNIAANSGSDTLEFGVGIDIQNLILRRTGNDLEIAISTGDSDARAFGDIADRVTIKDWYSVGASIEKFAFTEIGALTVSGMTLLGGTDAADTLTGGSGVDWVSGGGGDDNLNGGSGNDIIVGGMGLDTLKGGLGDDTLLGGGGDDTLIGEGGVDALFGGAGADIASFSTHGTGVVASLAAGGAGSNGDTFNSIEGLEGSNSADDLTGDSGDNVLRGLAGNDVLTGGVGDDSYEFQRGHKTDVIKDGAFVIERAVNASGVLDTALFSAAWTQIGAVNNSGVWTYSYRLVVTKTSTGEEVYRSRDNVDFVYTNQIVSTAPAASTWPGAGAQWKNGFRATNFGSEIARDLIVAGDGGQDSILFTDDTSLSDLTITRGNSGADLRIVYTASDQITIRGQNATDTRVESIQFKDGLAVDLTQLKLLGEAATSGDDLLFGSSGANTIDGLQGNDVISTAGGDDTLRGGMGDDVLEGGAGADTLDGGSDSQTDGLALSAASTGWGDVVRYVRSTAAVTIDLAAGTASGGDAAGDIIVMNAGVSTIEHVTGSDAYGDTLRGDARANRLYGLGGNDVVDGRAGDDVLVGGAGDDNLAGGDGDDALAGDDGNDVLSGGLGRDVLAGGAGIDTLQGDAGDDRLVGGDGDDTLSGGADNDALGGDSGNDALYGDAGDDQLVGGVGDDQLYGGDGDDTLAGETGNDSLGGELGDDIYVFDAKSGADTIVDVDGTNKIVISDFAYSALWLTRVGDNLKISALGVAESEFSITVTGYFAATTPTRLREIATQDASIFLAYADPLISAMTAAGTVAPTTMPTAITDTLSTYWHTGGKAAPRASDQNLSTDEDIALSGAVGAIDHDGNITAYAIDRAAAHGTVTLNAQTGAWIYSPAANIYGADSFAIRVTDVDGHSIVQSVAVVVGSINDAPHDIVLSGALAGIVERDRPLQGAVLDPIALGTLSASDVDAPDAGDFASFVYSVADVRFEVVSGNVLRLKAGAALDFEAGASVDVVVTATDRNGVGLFYTKTLTFAVIDADDYLYGTAGGETLTGQEGRNIIFGFGGADVLQGAGASDQLNGGDGSDQLFGQGGDDQLSGDLGDDALDGGAGHDVLDGGAGNDSLLGGDGNDTLIGAAGLDTLDGGLGDDTLQGGDDADSLVGGGGNDRLEGGAGDDVMQGGAGADRFLGGSGFDTVSYASAANAISVNLSTLSGAVGEAAGDVFEDAPEKLIGSSYGDTLTGSAGADEIHGGAGDDVMLGGAGNDMLYGGDGNDTIDAQFGNDMLDGGAGNDILIGGDDSDVYLITVNSGADEIRNFDPNGTDIDVIGYQDIDRSRLWFERAGNDLIVSVIGTAVVTRIKDWYVVTSASDRANYKIDFILAGQHSAKTINAEGLVALMAGYAKPADIAAYTALHANSGFENQWRNFWDGNGAPSIAAIANQTINEDGSLTLTINVTDDVTPATGVAVTAFAVQPGNPTAADGSIVSAVAVSGADASGNRTLTVTTLPNRSGVTAIKVQAVDAGGVLSERVFQLNVTPIADAPIVTRAIPVSPTSPLTKPTLDSGSWALDVQAALGDQDGSETLEIRIANVPAALSFNQGANLGGGVWSFAPAQLPGLRLQGPATYATDLSGVNALRVTSIGRELASGASATSAETLLSVEINARPTDIVADRALAFDENTPNTWGLAWIGRTDPDGSGDAPSYQLLNDAGGRFTLRSDGLLMAGPTPMNYETAQSHIIRVRVTDAGGLTYDKDLTVSVNNVNEAPTDIWADRVLSFNEGAGAGAGLAWFGGADPDNYIASFSLVDSAGGRFALDANGLLKVGGSTLDFESGGGSSNILVRATDAGGFTYDEWFTITVNDVNEAPILTAQSFSVAEGSPGAGQTLIGTLAVYDPDTQASNRDFRFKLSGPVAHLFSINSAGQIYLQTNLDYEAAQLWGFTAEVWDQGAIGSGLTSSQWIQVNVTNVNEAPVLTAADIVMAGGHYSLQPRKTFSIQTSDPEGGGLASATIYATSTVGGVDPTSISPTIGLAISGANASITLERTYIVSYDIRLQDLQGAISNWRVTGTNLFTQLPPIAIDLNGDGVELVALDASSSLFDWENVGDPSRTGWVGASDAFLALDRNADGAISYGQEISFIGDLPGAASDLEGLVAFDSNENGLLDSGDVRFGDFLVWQDVNQDGVSQTDELQSLSQRGIASISLTRILTGQSAEGATDNVILATSHFTRTDGTTGEVGDVMLAYEQVKVEFVELAAEEEGVAGADMISHAAANESDASLNENVERRMRYAHDAGAGEAESPRDVRRRDRSYAANSADAAASSSPDRRADGVADSWLRAHAQQPRRQARDPFANLKKLSRAFADVGARQGLASEDDWRRGFTPADLPIEEFESSAYTRRPSAPEEPLDVTIAAQSGSALHGGLGVMDRKLLGMVDAIAGFEAQPSTDLATRKKTDPRVAELLTSLPNIR